MKWLLINIIILGILSCKSTSDKNTVENPTVSGNLTYDDTTILSNNGNNNQNANGELFNCNFENILNDSTTPELAKKLINNTAIYSEEPLFYFENLVNKDKEIAAFYFKALTNSYNYSDGAYAEGLGGAGFSFVKNNTKRFVEFFDNKDCFTAKDLETWVSIVMIEVALVSDNEFDEALIDDYIRDLNQKCGDCSLTQQATLKAFNLLLKEQWLVLLTNKD